MLRRGGKRRPVNVNNPPTFWKVKVCAPRQIRYGVTRCRVSKAKSISKMALYVAAAGSAVVAVLLGAAALDIGAESLRYHPTPRINTLTVGFGLLPVAALAWIVYLWTHEPVEGNFDLVLRLVITGGLLVGGFYSGVYALFAAYFVS